MTWSAIKCIIKHCTNNTSSYSSKLQSARTNRCLPFTPKHTSILPPPPHLPSFRHALDVDVCWQSIICCSCWHSNHGGGNRNDVSGGNKHTGSRRRIQQSSTADPAERPSEHPVFHERSVGTVFWAGVCFGWWCSARGTIFVFG